MNNITSYSVTEEAMCRRDVAEVQRLLTLHRKDLEAKGWMYQLFRTAACRNLVEMLPLFLPLGVDVNTPADSIGDAPPEGIIYYAAATHEAVDSVRWLLEHGAKINYQVEGVTRCVSLLSRNLEIVKMLVEHGADVNAVWAGNNALSFAVAYGNKEVEAYLRSKGALLPRELAAQRAPVPDPIRAHVERHLGKPNPLELQEIVPGDPPVSVLVVPLSGGRSALVTRGMSSKPMNVPPGQERYRLAELVTYLPAGWPLDAASLAAPRHSWPVDWLRRLARWPHQNQTWLGGPHVIIANGEPPAPLGPGTRLSCLLVTAQDADAAWLTLPDGRQVAFYSVFPVYAEERDLERRRGWEHLMRLFQSRRVPFEIDLARPNVALPQEGKKP